MAHGHNHDHDHDHCISDAVARAEEVCATRGARFTDLRRRVLELVWQSHKAVKAYDILDLLGREGGSSKPPTVYRALDFLMEHGLVHRIESMNAFVGCTHTGGEHMSQFLICDECETVTEVSNQSLEAAIYAAADRDDFEIKSQMLEVHGICSTCSGRGETD